MCPQPWELQLMVVSPAFAENLANSEALLARFQAGPLPHLIGGKPASSASGATFADFSPIDGSRLCDVAEGGPEEIDAAALAATEAFGAWRDTPPAERKRILLDTADLIEERAYEIAVVECADTGQSMRFMSSAALRGAENFRFFADRAPAAADGRSLPSDHHVNYTTRHPIGPVGVITPWNTPFMLSTWKIAPALAAGCTVVHKPAEWSPLTSNLLAQAAADAGLPPGVLNVVHGKGETAGRALTEHPSIKAISFVGESATGSAIQAQGAPTLKRLHFELGGKNPVIVFDDANLERALDAVVFMIFSLNGERCTSSSRLLVQESIHDEFYSRVAGEDESCARGAPVGPADGDRAAHPPASLPEGPQLSGSGPSRGGSRRRRRAVCRRPRGGELDSAGGDRRCGAPHARRQRGDLRPGAHRSGVRRRS